MEVCAFFRAVHVLWVAAGQYAELCVEDVKDELFDIVRPAHPLRITAADLLVRARCCLMAIAAFSWWPLWCKSGTAWSA